MTPGPGVPHYLLVRFISDLCFESVLGDCGCQLFKRDPLRIVRDKQQIEVFLRFQFPFPLVFDRLDTVKL